MEKVIGIKLSKAALIRENAFRDVLGFDNEEIKNVSGDHKLERHCGDQPRLQNVLDHIRTDSGRGLPSMDPPRQIQPEVINAIGLGSTVATLDTTISDNAFYEK